MSADGRAPLAGDWALAPAGAQGTTPPPDAWRPMAGPMPVAAALQAAGAWSLDGPARDFDAECWWVRCRFDRPAGLDDATLGLDGLATLATVWLNGEHLLDSRNMFRSHALPVGRLLRATGNELLMRFDPLADALAPRRPRPRWRAPMVAHQQLRWFRTTLLGRTPGWSPPAAVVGPWRPVWLADASRVPQVLHLQPRLDGSTGVLSLRCRLPGVRAAGAASTPRATAAAPVAHLALQVGGAWHEAALLRAEGLEGGEAGSGPGTVWQAELRVPGITPWWPHTHGTPALHTAELRVAGEAPLPLGRVGFRRVGMDTAGGGCGLVVNGEPVFVRGACWVPLDTMRLHAGREHCRAVLTRLRDAGLNTVRVGGTMAYESADFFELCDELGLLVWQELMFANLDYPADDPAWRAEVDAELAGQWPLWARHACVAVVCGNSEVSQQAAMWGAAREHWQPPLFHHDLAEAAAAALPGVPYWPSSAHGGAFPFQPAQGTTSYYGVGAYRRGLGDARASGLRFATECLAFAQVPPDATLARLRALNADAPLRTHSPLWKARSPRDLGAGWDFDDVRDHYVQALFGEDPAALRMSDPARHLVLGRAAVAEAVTAAFSQWRAADSACRGALVWFLRDLWAGAGWGYLDDLGRPKAAFLALARVCQPLHLGVTDEGLNGLRLHLANEAAAPRQGTLQLALYREGEWLVAQAARPWSLPARTTVAVDVTDLLEGFADLSWAYRFGPPPADVLVARWVGEGADANLACERVHFLGTGDVPLPRAELGLAGEARLVDGGAVVEVTLHTRAAARGVHVEVEGWQPEDEHFHLAPGAQRALRFTPWPGHAPRPWRATVSAINARAPVALPLVAG